MNPHFRIHEVGWKRLCFEIRQRTGNRPSMPSRSRMTALVPPVIVLTMPRTSTHRLSSTSGQQVIPRHDAGLGQLALAKNGGGGFGHDGSESALAVRPSTRTSCPTARLVFREYGST